MSYSALNHEGVEPVQCLMWIIGLVTGEIARAFDVTAQYRIRGSRL